MTRKRPRWVGFLIGALIIGLIAGAALWVLFAPVQYPRYLYIAPTSRPVYHVLYRVTGTSGHMSYTLANGTGGTEQGEVFASGGNFGRSPWEYSFTATTPGQFLYISVSNEEGGSLFCALTVNGQVLQNARADGRYGSVTCSGSVEP